MKRYYLEMIVGIFMLLGIAALIMLAFKVSGLTDSFTGQGYEVTANFDNIGDLKIRAPVTMAGVRIGQVRSIKLDPQSFRAIVTLEINNAFNEIPKDSSASIYTQGLLGANYISLDPGYDNVPLKNGDQIQETHPALILENLIGQFLFKVGDTSSNSDNKQ